MEPPSSKDNRRYRRIETPTGVWVSWGVGEAKSVSRVADFNAGGMFISTPAAPPVGTTIKVLMVVPEGEIRAQAIVRNMSPEQGMGIEFTAMGGGRQAMPGQADEAADSFGQGAIGRRAGEVRFRSAGAPGPLPINAGSSTSSRSAV